MGVATDHVIESFRNDLWPGYKTGEGVDPDLWSQAWPLEDGAHRPGGPGLADGRARGGRRAGQRRGRGRRRPGGGAGHHLHAGQGSRAVRARGPRRAAGPAQGPADRRGRASPPSSGWARPPSPTTWRSSATAPTAFPGLPGGGPSRPPPCWPGGPTSRTSRPIPATGMSRCAARPSWRRRCGSVTTRRGSSRSWRRCASTARCCSRWTTCVGRARRVISPQVCADLDAPGIARRAEALAATR